MNSDSTMEFAYCARLPAGSLPRGCPSPQIPLATLILKNPPSCTSGFTIMYFNTLQQILYFNRYIYIYIYIIYIHKIHITLHIIQQKIFSQILKQVLQHFDFPTIGIPGLAGVAGGGLDAASSAAASQIAAAQPRGVHVGWVQEWKKSKYNALIYRYTMSHSLYYCYCIMIC